MGWVTHQHPLTAAPCRECWGCASTSRRSSSTGASTPPRDHRGSAGSALGFHTPSSALPRAHLELLARGAGWDPALAARPCHVPRALSSSPLQPQLLPSLTPASHRELSGVHTRTLLASADSSLRWLGHPRTAHGGIPSSGRDIPALEGISSPCSACAAVVWGVRSSHGMRMKHRPCQPFPPPDLSPAPLGNATELLARPDEMSGKVDGIFPVAEPGAAGGFPQRCEWLQREQGPCSSLSPSLSPSSSLCHPGTGPSRARLAASV